MALQEEMEQSGVWLFRWRSYLPLLMLGVTLLAMRDYTFPGNNSYWHYGYELFCLSISYFGLGIRILTIGHTPRRTSGRNTRKQVAETLNTTGLYSITRNPLYLGNFFMGLGVVLFVHVWWLTLIYTLAFWLYYERIILAEEAFLQRQFGKAYQDWAQHTPPFIPNLRHYQAPDLPFSPRNVLRREYNGFFMVILVFFLLELTGDLILLHSIKGNTEWFILLLGSFVIWCTLRTLKKHTTILNVAGR